MELFGVHLRNPFDRDFWEEPPENVRYWTIPASLAFFAVLILMWILTFDPVRGNIYMAMMILSMVSASLMVISRRTNIMRFVCIGRDLQTLITSFIFGILVALILMLTIFSLSKAIIPSPLTSITNTATIPASTTLPLSETQLLFLYIVIIAPFVEENFFRMAALPSGYNVLKSWIAARWDNYYVGWANMLLMACAFGFMHWVAYGANMAYIQNAVVFGIIASVGNYITGSAFFGFGLHFANNLMAWMGGT